MDFHKNFTKLIGVDNQTLMSTDVVIVTTSDLHPLHHVLILSFACLGVVGNTIAAVVWGTLVKTRPGAFFLTSLSVADTLFCCAMIVVKSYEWKGHFDCNVWIIDELGIVFIFISRHLTAAVIAQRWLVVSRPLSAARLCTMRRQFIALISLLLSLLGITVFGFYTRWLMYANCLGYVTTESKWEIIYLHITNEVLIFIWNAIIVLCLLVFSSLLLYSTCTIQKMQTQSLNVTWHRDLELRMTAIHLCLAAFSLVEIFTSLVYTLYAARIHEDEYFNMITSYIYPWTLVLNSVVNFVIYSCLGREFRERLWSTWIYITCRRVEGTAEQIVTSNTRC